jgi:hypothetical protein
MVDCVAAEQAGIAKPAGAPLAPNSALGGLQALVDVGNDSEQGEIWRRPVTEHRNEGPRRPVTVGSARVIARLVEDELFSEHKLALGDWQRGVEGLWGGLS